MGISRFRLTTVACWVVVAVLTAVAAAHAVTPRVASTFRFGGKASDAALMARTPDGRLVVAGSASDTSEFTGVAALRPDGRPDSTAGGVAVHDILARDDDPRGLDPTADGGVLVTGTVQVPAPSSEEEPDDYDAFVLRLGRDGRPVPGFGANGTVVLRPGRGREAFEQASSARLLPDGRVLVAGDDDRGVFLARLLGDGRLDPTFGTGGVVHPFPRIREAFQVGLADPGGGSVVVVASAVVSGAIEGGVDTRDFDWMAGKVDLDGRPDPSFGRAGVVLLNMAGEGRSDQDFVEDARVVGGRILVTGLTDDSRLAAARLRSDGALDRSYGRRGRARAAPSGEGWATAIDRRGAAWFAASNGRRTTVSRLDSRGRTPRVPPVVVDLSRRRHEIVRAVVPPSGASPAMLAVTVGGSTLFAGDVSIVALRP